MSASVLQGALGDASSNHEQPLHRTPWRSPLHPSLTVENLDLLQSSFPPPEFVGTSGVFIYVQEPSWPIPPLGLLSLLCSKYSLTVRWLEQGGGKRKKEI